MGKTANGVKAIDLEDGDFVSDVFVYRDEPFVFMHSESQGKLVSIEDINELRRGKMKRGQTGRQVAKLKK